MSTTQTSASNQLVTTKGSIIKDNQATQDQENKYIPFSKLHSFEKRAEESKRTRENYPGKIPVIVERLEKNGYFKVPLVKKCKYLLTGDITLSQYISTVLRPSLKLSSNDELTIFIGDDIPEMNQTCTQLSDKYCKQSDIDSKKIDGMLYIGYTGASTVSNIAEEKGYVPYRKAFSLETRQMTSSKAKLENPNKIPVLIERLDSKGAVKLPLLKKREFIVNKDMSLGQFIAANIRPSLNLGPENAIIVFVNNTLPSMSTSMGQLYQEHTKEGDDGYLQLDYMGESTFGSC